MTNDALTAALAADVTPGDRLFVVFKAAPFSIMMTEQGPMPTINKIAGNFVALRDGVLVLDETSADGHKLRQYVHADEIVMVGSLGQVALARPRLV